MDPLANLIGVLEEGENEIPEKKKEKKKKMTPAMIKKLQMKMAEEARQLLIRQRQEYLRETKSRVQNEWEMNLEKAHVYEAEFESKLKQLTFSFQRLQQVETSWKEHVKERKKNEEWSQYLKCGHLPNPSSIPEVNSYIFELRELDTDTSMPHFLKKTEDVMELLNGLEELIKDPGPGRTPQYVMELKNLRQELRELLGDQFDSATFALCSRIEHDMESINVTTSKYFASCAYFQMSLWAELITPIPSSKLKEVRHPLRVVLDDTNIEITIPVSLLDYHKIVRAIWLDFDHFSDLCRSYSCPPVPGHFDKNMMELFLSQNVVKLEIMSDRAKQELIMKRKIGAIPLESTLSQEILAWESEPQRALSEEIAFREWKLEDDLGRQVKESLDQHEVNMRERTILGELLAVHVLHQPSQPKHLRYKHSVTLRKEPAKLQAVNFYVQYPPPKAEASKEVTEEEKEPPTRQRLAMKREEEDEIKKLLIIQLKPCSSVIWFEQPSLACWDNTRKYWSTEDIHNPFYDEEEDTITFKIGRFGVIGMHVSRYCNFPFQDWIFEPDDTGKINFYLKTPKAEFHFKIRETEVCLESMSGVPSKAMNWILGLYYPPVKLRKALKKGGINIFPEPDAGSYVEDVFTKHVVVENNIYQVWAMFHESFRFKFSRFCQVARRENVVFQAQEIYKNHQVDYCLIKVSMGSCCVLDIREDSEMYSSDPAPHMECFADLYNLLTKNCTMRARRRSDVTSYLLVQTVQDFLGSVRPLSFTQR